MSFLIPFLIMIFSSLQASPFKLDFQEMKELTPADYVLLQSKLNDIHIDTYLSVLYPNMDSINSFFFRCQKGTSQILIDPEKGFYPYERLIKIGEGGDVCLVCCVPFNKEYPELIESIPQALTLHNFNGYFLYRVGGFPNPTGKEILYTAVPYSFKIFMMIEAYQKGFNKVMWIDSSLLPLRDLQPLIDQFNEKECFLVDGTKKLKRFPHFILPIAREALQEVTSFDPIECDYVSTLIFGLHMNTKKAQKLIELYYQCVEKGTPFLSHFPEEIVLTTIVGRLNSEDLEEWSFSDFKNLIGGGGKEDSLEEKILNKQNQGFYFYYRSH